MVRIKRRKAPKKGRQKIKKNQRANKSHALKKVSGHLKLHRDGYGFVMVSDEKQPDIFIPPRYVNGAMDGDEVLVSLAKRDEKGRYEGKILEVIKHHKKWLVGILKKDFQGYYLETTESKPPLEFNLEEEDLFGAKLGDTLGIEIFDYPQLGQRGSGKMIQIFGERGDEKTETGIIILKYQLRNQFSKSCLAEAEQLKLNPPVDEAISREDLRHLAFVTIDGEKAQDFDDAIYVEKKQNVFKLFVSIADVSHYVKPGSAIDQEAFARGTSVYFPDQVIPMLPEILSNDLCSLRPFEDRMSFTAEIDFNLNGLVQKSRFYKSIISSKARITYRQLAKALMEENTEEQNKIKEVLPMLKAAYELAHQIRDQRQRRGSIDFDLPEPEFITNLEEGNIESIIKAERNEAHMLIEDFMIAANEAVASFVKSQDLPMVYRIHQSPDSQKIYAFKELLHHLGFHMKLSDEPSPKELSKILDKVKDHPEEKLIQQILLRSMRQAVYSTETVGHYGLASNCYTHFTSPIRRYPDLMVHRILAKVLENKKNQQLMGTEQLQGICEHSSRRERVAMEAEWEAVNLKIALFMQQYLGREFEGMVSRISKYGFFVELKDQFVEGLVLLKDLDEYYVFEEKRYRLMSRGPSKNIIKLGKQVTVQVSHVDIEERQILFKWIK
ncbi:MAG: ribonuclease R [Deltaproteobacteria bacterium]|nr:ribonuclease R [Deltaproteobacteria bacterium]